MTRTTLRRHPMLRRAVISLLVVLLVGGATAVARAATGSPGPGFRVATAQQGSVAQTLTATGTVDPIKRADVAFAASGTVRSVQVGAGDTVAQGQSIATLERAGLKAALEAVKADLAKARAQLESDQAAQADAVATSSATDTSSGTDTGTSSRARLARQQQAVRSAQTRVAQALAEARPALAAQSSVCSGAFQSVSSSSEQNGACAAALATVQDSQSAVAVAQDELQDAMGKLAETLRKAATDPASSTESSAPVADGGQGDGDTGAVGDDSAVSSASRIASDQASIDAAKAAVLRARQELAQTRLVAPIAGTAASVDVEPGQQVSAGDVALVIVGAGSVRIETTVSESRVRQIEVGQPASVTVVGAPDSSSGTVTSVGLVPDTSSGSVSYPVTVTVPGSAVSMPAGSAATVAIVIATAEDVLTVPSSAVSRRGGSATVTAIKDGQTVTERVQTGVVGALRTEITDGLRPGARVILADLSRPLPSGDGLSGRGLDGNASRDGPGGPPDEVGTVRIG